MTEITGPVRCVRAPCWVPWISLLCSRSLLETELAQDQWGMDVPVCREIGNDGLGQVGPDLLFDLGVIQPFMLCLFLQFGTDLFKHIRFAFHGGPSLNFF